MSSLLVASGRPFKWIGSLLYRVAPRSHHLAVELPRSHMELPARLREWPLFVFWYVWTPFHPYVRDLGLALGVVSHPRRQRFLFGTLASDRTPESFALYLASHGYGVGFPAWEEEGEVLSMRRTEGFARQYHLRLFADGEIRGHYESTPEASPWTHLKATGTERRPEVFTPLLTGWVVPSRDA